MGLAIKYPRLFCSLNFICFGLACIVQAQSLEIINSDALYMRSTRGEQYKVLSGNVQLKDKDLLIFCDSAILFEERKYLEAIGHIYIEKEASIKLRCDSLVFNQNTNNAIFKNNVRLNRDNLHLTTKEILYNDKNGIAYFNTEANITNGELKINCQKGFYNTKTEKAHFINKVNLTSKDINLKTDTLIYSKSDESYAFQGKSKILKSDSKAKCYKGFYNPKTEASILEDSAVIEHIDFYLSADYIELNDIDSSAKANTHVLWMDSSRETHIYSQNAYYSRKNKSSRFFNQVLLLNTQNSDSLYIMGDTLEHSDKDSSMTFYPNAYIYQDKNIARCDTLIYSSINLEIALIGDPRLQMDSTYLSSDSLWIYMRDKNTLDRLKMVQNSWILNLNKQGLYNQIKSKKSIGTFKNKKLNKMLCYIDAESLYFAENEKGEFIGYNKSECDSISIKFNDNKISQVNFLGTPKSSFNPIDKNNRSSLQLKGLQKEELDNILISKRLKLYQIRN